MFCKGRFDAARARAAGVQLPRRAARSWCGETFAALQSYERDKWWSPASWQEEEFTDKDQWADGLEEDIRGVAEGEWRRGVGTKSSLDLYRSIKTNVAREPFLDCPAADNRAAALRVGLRGGVHSLEVSCARLARSRPA